MKDKTTFEMLSADFLPMLAAAFVFFLIFGVLCFHAFETAVDAIQ